MQTHWSKRSISESLYIASHPNAEKGVTFTKIPIVKGTTDVGYSEITLWKEIPGDAKIVGKVAFFVVAKMTSTVKEEE